ncbi:WLM domain-containing protein [Xylariomycetidae sp. FL2044]|nr:WLM domain-containing protein [Xylariomycetidae sp. FL2044]
MPIGIQRLNAKKSQPNDRVIFIKPLKGPDEATAQDFLHRIAAQCLPIMREHHLSVMSLEEYEPNREFVGRNFNAGEVIQLVLKSPSTGRWLPFNYVQMVMMHELAHCKQMNHSKAFWAVRNQYADQMRSLWTGGYTGEGLWGRGALLETGEFERNTVRPDEILPEHLCGGTYRSRRRKRKAKQQLSYQERKERRILKKFGANGVSLGEDEGVKAELEKGKRTQAKPRVAGSKRGRELRAAAALARFGQQKKKEEEREEVKKPTTADEDESGSDTGFETASDSEDDEPNATDANGRRLLDNKGHGLIKVCEDENPEDGDAQNELRELTMASYLKSRDQGPKIKTEEGAQRISAPEASTRREKTGEGVKGKKNKTQEGAPTRDNKTSRGTPGGKEEEEEENGDGDNTTTLHPAGRTRDEGSSSGSNSRQNTGTTCPMCSFENGPETTATICGVCSHVLDPARVPGSWRCGRSETCRGSRSRYLNAGDSGICGVCGERKASYNQQQQQQQ